jgi:hypothetical protein
MFEDLLLKEIEGFLMVHTLPELNLCPPGVWCELLSAVDALLPFLFDFEY